MWAGLEESALQHLRSHPVLEGLVRERVRGADRAPRLRPGAQHLVRLGQQRVVARVSHRDELPQGCLVPDSSDRRTPPGRRRRDRTRRGSSPPRGAAGAPRRPSGQTAPPPCAVRAPRGSRSSASPSPEAGGRATAQSASGGTGSAPAERRAARSAVRALRTSSALGEDTAEPRRRRLHVGRVDLMGGV